MGRMDYGVKQNNNNNNNNNNNKVSRLAHVRTKRSSGLVTHTDKSDKRFR